VTEAGFEVAVGPEQALEFARVSGDWNPLHTDPAHAAETPYRRPVLHGAYSAGLISRLAGMQLPGADCLLHGMRLRFVAPVILPARLRVHGRLVAEAAGTGRVEATVTDADSGLCYVEAGYEFSRHHLNVSESRAEAARSSTTLQGTVLVTGASGGLGQALVELLGNRAIPVSRTAAPGMLHAPDLEALADQLGDTPIDGIVHCAWPAPDNVRLTRLPDSRAAVEHQVAQPLRQMIGLARLLEARGTPEAALVLVGSTFAHPGRHNFRMPLYTLAKGMIPSLAHILALELASANRRSVAVVFDVIDAGMNRRLTAAGRLAHADRTLRGQLPSAEDAARQILWVLDNRSALVSGATLTLSGGALP
jgi:NAD(P)-dependent dehydrogenase (short-subunit alcohol dehydrogenase family)/acyl dehydratase